ncbi:MAG: alpha/beta hydrolase [candidate division KSB1 bacterium]|nr:alpha/beta hydrolase [candidate division KSB1 bacterium]
MRLFIVFHFALLLLVSSTGYSQEVIKLWSDKIPGARVNTAIAEEKIVIENGSYRIQHVIEPTLMLYFPKPEQANGAAVIICPGGGYARLAMSHEGIEIAQWLAANGIVGIILKYRLPDDAIMENKAIGPLQDIQEAVRMARRNSQRWQIDPKKIGVIGFSAGGHLAASISTHFNKKIYDADSTSARPDFAILIYPVISMKPRITHPGSRDNLLGEAPDSAVVELFSNELQVSAETPPTFLVHAADDKSVSVQNSIEYFVALNQHGVPAELHIYEQGGHGFGLGKKTTAADWSSACLRWLKSRGVFK